MPPLPPPLKLAKNGELVRPVELQRKNGEKRVSRSWERRGSPP